MRVFSWEEGREGSRIGLEKERARMRFHMATNFSLALWGSKVH